ncbi:hypothetical protein HMN09_00368400 [Mycena chlorophos]|uniref:Uncharacterized protein n=1 Tax=Mycena chlorophos TaxID=658473 RepID=A0A8H6WNA1_MYCCL|nr:hypothetical protein HMN09_00368400 [Mycena chlorophos]
MELIYPLAQAILDGYSAYSAACSGFLLEVYDLGPLGIDLQGRMGADIGFLQIKHTPPSRRMPERWSLQIDGLTIGSFSISRASARQLRNFTIDGATIAFALGRSLETCRHVELEVGSMANTLFIDPATEIRTSFPASPLILRTYHESSYGHTPFPARTQFFIGLTRHHPFGGWL